MKPSLDDRLRHWHQSQRPAAAPAALAQDIARELRRQARFAAAPAPAPRAGLGIKFAYAALGGVLMLAAVAVWQAAPRRAAPPSPATFARIDAAQLAVHGRLFGEIQNLFANQLRWITETDQNVDFGVSPDDGGAPPSGPPLCVRVTVVARDDANAPWKPVWYQDVVLRSEDRVQINTGADHGGRLGLWVCRLDDGRLAVESDYALTAPVPLRSWVDTVQDAGQPAQVLSVREGGTEYRVYQTVSRIPPATPKEQT